MGDRVIEYSLDEYLETCVVLGTDPKNILDVQKKRLVKWKVYIFRSTFGVRVMRVSEFNGCRVYSGYENFPSLIQELLVGFDATGYADAYTSTAFLNMEEGCTSKNGVVYRGKNTKKNSWTVTLEVDTPYSQQYMKGLIRRAAKNRKIIEEK